MSVRGKIDPKWDLTFYEDAAGDEGPLRAPVKSSAGPITIVSGVGDGARADEMVSSGAPRTLGAGLADVWDFVDAAGVNVNYNATGDVVMPNPANEAVILTTAVAKLKGIQIEHYTLSASGPMSVVGTLFGGAGTLFVAAGDGFYVGQGGHYQIYDPVGYTLTAGADTVTITNTGASDITYSVKWLFATS